MKKIAALFLLLAPLVLPDSAIAHEDITITGYRARVVPDIQNRSVNGRTFVTFSAKRDGDIDLRFPLNNLTIEDVKSAGVAIAFRIDNAQLVIPLSVKKSDSSRELAITYHGTPKQGLKFGANYVYTAFSTCHWMICHEESGDKATFRLELIVPAKWRVVASGREVSAEKLGSELVLHKWSEDRPYSPYLFGFAASEFTTAATQTATTELLYFGIDQNADELKRKFADTERMLKFLEQKAGGPLPHKTYSQVLLPGSEAQEASTFSLIGRNQLDPALTDPQEDWVIVHELAHQWWGNLITCKDWSHFWLNEGLTVFMVAAYKEERWGRAAYDREMELAKKRHQTAVAAKFDVPLAYAKEYPSLQIKRAITYSKGALFLDALRKQLGDEIFWKGIRAYTQRHLGRTVDSRDFQRAMEESAGHSLASLFQQWVGE